MRGERWGLAKVFQGFLNTPGCWVFRRQAHFYDRIRVKSLAYLAVGVGVCGGCMMLFREMCGRQVKGGEKKREI